MKGTTLNMAGETNSSNSKKSRAEYFREYRRRKSTRDMTSVKHLRIVRTQSASNITQSLINSQPQLTIHRAFLIIVALCTTAYLVFVSSSYFDGPNWLRVGLALLTESILLVLVTLKPTTLIEKGLRSFLLLAFLGYSILPYVTEPLKNQTEAIKFKELLRFERQSLEREIFQIKGEHQHLLDRDRLTKAHSVAQQLATLENKLRATFEMERTSLQQQSEQRLPTWVLSLQRLLFVFFNLFLIHVLVATPVAQQSEEVKPRLQLVAKKEYPFKEDLRTTDSMNWSNFKKLRSLIWPFKLGHFSWSW